MYELNTHECHDKLIIMSSKLFKAQSFRFENVTDSINAVQFVKINETTIICF